VETLTETLVFFYFFLPEMRGRSLEELDELFQNNVPVREFSRYQCVSSERAKEMAVKVTTGMDADTEKLTAAAPTEGRV
jgi:hypothetical protein